MPLIATRGAASAQGFGEFAQTTAPVYIEDVFSTYLYTGNSSTQTITNGIDLSTKGGLVWAKCRTLAANHRLTDTVRGAGNSLISNSTLGTQTATGNGEVSSFTTTGYTTNLSGFNSTDTHVSWTFREQPKFFDIVTYTGNGTNPRNITHNLGSTPGCIIVKRTDTTGNWNVYHRSAAAGGFTAEQCYMYLNSTNAVSDNSTFWSDTAPTSTQFTVGSASNANGGTYVAYLFAHNAGGFGLTGSDNVISCGSYTGNSGTLTVNLGYEPQWLLVKRTDFTGNWALIDVMRGWIVGASSQQIIYANTSGAETGDTFFGPTATGFSANLGGTWNTNGGTYIYIAIRRGPMKTPTSGTSVFIPVTYAGNGSTTAGQLVTSNFPVDMGINRYNIAGSGDWDLVDRLRGLTSIGVSPDSRYLNPPSTAAEGLGGYIFDATNTSVDNYGFSASFTQLNYLFQRAPGFFDVVCDTGTGSAHAITHNLGVTPEFIIRKTRSGVAGWFCYHSALGNTKGIFINSTLDAQTDSGYWNNTSPTSTQFTVGTSGDTNQNTSTFVTYLFATVAGVSKVGSYTGTGALQTVNCGFTGGARFVLIKRTDSTGDWWVYDSARGISSGNDPYLFLNSNAAGVTNTNYVDTTSVGFQVTAAAPAGLNANGGTYIFLAIA